VSGSGTLRDERLEDGGNVRTVSDRVLGWVGGAMVLGALLLLLFGGPGDEGAAPASPPPGIALESPRNGAVIDGALEVRFRIGGVGERMPGGWGVGEYHLHAELDGREIMPSPADIRRLPDGAYAWTIGTPSPGEREIRLFWSDRAHRPVAEGATGRVRVTVR
jgi:hypothetical protein